MQNFVLISILQHSHSADTNVIKVEICNKCHPYFTESNENLNIVALALRSNFGVMEMASMQGDSPQAYFVYGKREATPQCDISSRQNNIV